MQFIDLLLVRCIFGGQIGHNNYEDFEHPTLQGAWDCFIRLPRALPWAMENIGLSARTGYASCRQLKTQKQNNSKLKN